VASRRGPGAALASSCSCSAAAPGGVLSAAMHGPSVMAAFPGEPRRERGRVRWCRAEGGNGEERRGGAASWRAPPARHPRGDHRQCRRRAAAARAALQRAGEVEWCGEALKAGGGGCGVFFIGERGGQGDLPWPMREASTCGRQGDVRATKRWGRGMRQAREDEELGTDRGAMPV
jgi:hypothetical protein